MDLMSRTTICPLLDDETVGAFPVQHFDRTKAPGWSGEICVLDRVRKAL